jgi:hypothetical protein
LRSNRSVQAPLAAHIDDAEVIEVLQDLGYTEDTLPLLYLMPVIDTAWATGSVDSRERKLIEDLAVAHGVSKGSAAFDRLTNLLAERPSEAEMETNLLAVKAILASLPADERAEAQKSLIANCTTLATVGRKLFGGREIPKAERESIEHIILSSTECFELDAIDVADELAMNSFDFTRSELAIPRKLGSHIKIQHFRSDLAYNKGGTGDLPQPATGCDAGTLR